jgi:hypothetical protein
MGGCSMEDYGDWIWDESEYNFFMSLDDVDKLEYVFDYFNFKPDDYDEVEFLPEMDESHAESVDVSVVITDTHLTISCDKTEIIDRTIRMFIMDGFILMLQSSAKNDTTRVYKFIGQSNPYSVN